MVSVGVCCSGGSIETKELGDGDADRCECERCAHPGQESSLFGEVSHIFSVCTRRNIPSAR